MKHRTGAVFIAFAAYTNEDGEQTYARQDYNSQLHYRQSNDYLDMRLRILSSSPLARGIAKAPTILLTCGRI
jgi:hypothetical protein